MAAGSKFPLLQLPHEALLRTFRIMNLYHILKFSFISKRCKDLVLSVQIKGTYFNVFIGRTIEIFAGPYGKFPFTFYTEPDMYWGMGAYGRKKKLTAPQSVLVKRSEKRRAKKCRKNALSMKEWLEHIQLIFNYSKIDYIVFLEDSFEFDIDDIKEVFGNVPSLRFDNTGCYEFNQKIIEKFPLTEWLTIKTDDFQDSKVPKSLLLQNFSELWIEWDSRDDHHAIISLDELLLINSKVITAESLRLTPKQLNTFIKLWQKGANPRMEVLSIYFQNYEESDEEIFMKGIKHQVIPAGQSRYFKSAGREGILSVKGGMDFYRIDGVKATIEKNSFYSQWFMYVWFDHCVMES
ncbi:unnamed protein product [Caenorhabditis brenneri]